MICQSCGKKTATTHIKTIVNGRLTEYHLCEDCAREKGYKGMFSGFGGIDFGSLLGGFLSGSKDDRVTRCPVCGAAFDEIAKTGKLGCAHCYETFRHELLPAIQRIHGTTQHKGKTPQSSALRVKDMGGKLVSVKLSPLDEKKRELKKAIEAQEFEKAAVLRDEIKEMEKNAD